jgi:hypothetical protein
MTNYNAAANRAATTITISQLTCSATGPVFQQ